MSTGTEPKLDTWKGKLEGIAGPHSLPHASNLLRKLNLPEASTKDWMKAFEIILPSYIHFHSAKIDESPQANSPYYKIVHRVNKYLEILKTPQTQIFSHQSDFCSSVIPEFFFVLFSNLIKTTNLACEVSAQKDLIVECMFDSVGGGRIIAKKKRVDVAIYMPVSFEFNESEFADFCVPLIAMEVKTNIDKNMISGIEHAVESLKRTFPQCLYFAVCEFADFAIENQNYASTQIDEIIILRKQKRSSVRSGEAAKEIDLDLVEYITDLTKRHLKNSEGALISLSDRMNKGILISRKFK